VKERPTITQPLIVNLSTWNQARPISYDHPSISEASSGRFIRAFEGELCHSLEDWETIWQKDDSQLDLGIVWELIGVDEADSHLSSQ
jgi:hypothetical protein